MNETLDPFAEVMAQWQHLWAPTGQVPSGDEEPALTALIEVIAATGGTLKDALNSATTANRLCATPVDPEKIKAWVAAAFPDEVAKEGSVASDPAEEPRLTDLGNAERLVLEHGDDIRFCPGLGWLAWDDRHWAADDSGVITRAKATVKALWRDLDGLAPNEAIERAKWARASQHAQRIAAMVKLAESDPGIRLTEAAFDADPYLLNVQNGIIELKTGRLLPHDRGKLCTQIAGAHYDPDAKCPRFERFLGEVFEGDREVIAFVQRWFGYVLSGETIERKFVVGWGTGKNGKSTLFELFRDLLGDYATTTNPNVLCEQGKRGNGPSPEIARLRGVRLLIASETSAGQGFDEQRVKNMTGDESMVGRHCYKGEVVFRPRFRLMLATNHRPRCDGGDIALFDRVLVWPFRVRFDPPDKALGAALRCEMPGILAWTVRGCLEWQRSGLMVPDAVRMATEEYQHENDAVGRFLSERCTLGKGLRAPKPEFRRRYVDWCDEGGEKPLGAHRFKAALFARGVDETTIGGVDHWTGIQLGLVAQVALGGTISRNFSYRTDIEKLPKGVTPNATNATNGAPAALQSPVRVATPVAKRTQPKDEIDIYALPFVPPASTAPPPTHLYLGKGPASRGEESLG